MLSPVDGLTLLDALAPPPGYRLDVAVGTSYTLNLSALLAIPSAFALRRGSSSQEADGQLTPLDLLEALRSYTARITVFTDCAHIGVPTSPGNGVYSFLEGCVVPVGAPRGGAFHPKLWAVRFADDDGGHLHRLLIASRNLTFDRSWDALVRLDESDGEGGVVLPPLAEMLTALPALQTGARLLTRQRSTAIDDLAYSIARVPFDPPVGFDDLRLHPMGFHSTPTSTWPFPDGSRRTLVISPFLTRGATAQLAGSTGKLTVVSRGDELDRVYATSDGNRPAAFEVNSGLVDTADDANVLTDLHAKAFVFDQPSGRSTVFVGSANATTAAFTDNTEVLVELTGPSYRVGVGKWLDDENPSLRQMLVPHEWSEPRPDDSPTEELLKEIRTGLGQLEVVCTIIEGAPGQYRATYRSTTPLPDLHGARLRARPLTDAMWSPVTDPHIALERATGLPGLTALLGLQVELDGQTEQMTLLCALIGAPDDREDRLVAHLITNADRLIRYLLMLLTDQPEDRFDGVAQAIERAAARASGPDLDTIPLLELLLRTRARNPERLLSVGRLMDVVRRSPDLRNDDLLALWDAISNLPTEGHQ